MHTLILVTLTICTSFAVSARSANTYKKVPSDITPNYWIDFSEIKLGQTKQVNPELKVTKFSILDTKNKSKKILVGCQGTCKDFTCAKGSNAFRLGCVPSNECQRTEYELESKSENKTWEEQITESEIKLFSNK